MTSATDVILKAEQQRSSRSGGVDDLPGMGESDAAKRLKQPPSIFQRVIGETFSDALDDAVTKVIGTADSWREATAYKGQHIAMPQRSKDFAFGEIQFVLRRATDRELKFAQDIADVFDLTDEVELTLAYTGLLLSGTLNNVLAKRLESFLMKSPTLAPALGTNVLRAIDVKQERSGTGAFGELEDWLTEVEATRSRVARDIRNVEIGKGLRRSDKSTRANARVERDMMIDSLASFFYNDEQSRAFVHAIQAVCNGDITEDDVMQARLPTHARVVV
jgi:hypothetical protein